jgi:hypothetical protein
MTQGSKRLKNQIQRSAFEVGVGGGGILYSAIHYIIEALQATYASSRQCTLPSEYYCCAVMYLGS